MHADTYTITHWRRLLIGRVLRLSVNGRITPGWIADVLDGPDGCGLIAVWVSPAGDMEWLEPGQVWRVARRKGS